MSNLKLCSAYFVDYSTVVVNIANIPAPLAFNVKDEAGGDLPLTAVEYSASDDKTADTAFKISLGCEIDVGKAYSVVCKPQAEGAAAAVIAIKKFRLYDDIRFVSKYYYDGALGAHYTAKKTTFKVWSPVASEIKVDIYDSDDAQAASEYAMDKADNGVWAAEVEGDLNGKFYTYSVYIDGMLIEVVDPYARSAGKNGKRGVVVKPADTDPDGWKTHAMPAPCPFTKTVIYEAHLRDLTIHESSNVSENNRGKFLGMTEKGEDGRMTPLDYIKSLGVTAVHFLPLFDFASVDEGFGVAKYNDPKQYNWGYDPQNYNVPEGSYCSDPSNGLVRINELKQMIMALHNEGIRVIMDVVYNHMYDAGWSAFEALVPGYYFRVDGTGKFTNGSGCGNETASERPMFRKFMIDSLKYWMTEYRVDGFRFDLMGLHDIDTMNAIAAELKKINPYVMLYGEGWTGGDSPLPPKRRATIENAHLMPDIAVFDDIVRDGIRGSVFDIREKGYVSGGRGLYAPFVGIAGGTDAIGDLAYTTVGRKAFARTPSQNVNYVDCHDNATLWDKLNASVNADTETIKAMNRLAAAIVFTSQGASFIMAGEEMLRSKPTVKTDKYDGRPHNYIACPDYYFAENSYRSPDSVNAIDWRSAEENAETVAFYKGLIAVKRTFPHFCINDKKAIDKCVTIHEHAPENTVAYAMKDPDGDSYAFVIINNGAKPVSMSMPKGDYKIYVDGDRACENADSPLATFTGDAFTVGARSAVVMTAVVDRYELSGWAGGVKKSEKSGDPAAANAMGLGVQKTVLIAGGKVFGAPTQQED